MTSPKFWLDKKLPEMTNEEWESLCDGCGRCCLHKLEDCETGEIAYTNVACRLLDITSCRCKNYPMRQKLIPDCVLLTADQVQEFHWLPETCAYRLISEGKDLYPWHPLVSGTSETVHEALISVRDWAIPEQVAGDFEDHIIQRGASRAKKGPLP